MALNGEEKLIGRPIAQMNEARNREAGRGLMTQDQKRAWWKQVLKKITSPAVDTASEDSNQPIAITPTGLPVYPADPYKRK